MPRGAPRRSAADGDRTQSHRSRFRPNQFDKKLSDAPDTRKAASRMHTAFDELKLHELAPGFLVPRSPPRTTRPVQVASKRECKCGKNPAEVNDALDNFRRPFGAVAVGGRFVVHAGGIHSHIAPDRSRRAALPVDRGTKGCLIPRPAPKQRRPRSGVSPPEDAAVQPA